jgi:NAD(P)-dependent dehydrogenase (short-subunit alcohol dehydrogenase family)
MLLRMSWRPDGEQLRGRVAVVAGATRGAGRGIAAGLGEAGATVICTGRSSRRGGLTSDYQRPETIGETAELVTSLGGKGVPFAVDHLDTGQVAALADQVGARYGPVDVLVNDIWGAERLKGGPAQWNTPIWEQDLHAGLRILQLGVDTHLITSHYLLPLLVQQPGGLLVEVTDGTTEYNSSRYRLTVFYDLAKIAVNRLAFSLGHELQASNGTAVAVTPGFLRSEMMLDTFRVSELNWRDALQPQRAEAGLPVAPADFAHSESPRYVAGPSRPSRPTRPNSVGTSNRSPAGNSHTCTVSPTSTALNLTCGLISPGPRANPPAGTHELKSADDSSE